MELETSLKICKESFDRRMEIRKIKGHDYAQDTDCLANFKVTASICKSMSDAGMPIDITTPNGVAMFYGLLKFLRRVNLYSKNTEPLNESLRDTFDDAHNYLDLEYECYMDHSKVKDGS